MDDPEAVICIVLASGGAITAGVLGFLAGAVVGRRSACKPPTMDRKLTPQTIRDWFWKGKRIMLYTIGVVFAQMICMGLIIISRLTEICTDI